MITAKNYAAQAEAGLASYAKILSNKGDKFNIDIRNINKVVNIIKKSVHFCVPDGGFILNDGLKGLLDSEIRLPYPDITIEHYCASSLITKRVFVASEVLHNERPYIKIFSCNYSSIHNCWMLATNYFLLSKINSLTKKSDIKNDIGFNGIMGIASPGFFDFATSVHGVEKQCQNAEKDVALMAHFVCEFLEALSCRNVSQTIFQKAPNQNIANSRSKAGKLPIYETKILTINTDYQSSGKQRSSTSTHSSPRQHLRRGHIRRLESGNIWVNSCVVGDPNKGKISKTYHVE